jgi:hypothetical protein
MPDAFIAEYQNRIIPRAPAQAANQNGVEQADVITDEKITAARAQAFQTTRSAQVRKAEEKMRAQA